MDFPKSVPSAGLVDGKFIDEDALTGTPGSLIPSAWGNAITLEVLNVIQAAGLLPDEGDNAQLIAAIRALGKQPSILTDTGVVNAYTAVNTPPLAVLPATGYLQKIRIANTNSGAATYAPDGLGAKPIYGLGLQPLQGSELPVGVAVLMYLVQAGVNAGSGAWILIASLGGPMPIAPGNKGLHAVNVGQIQSQAVTAFTATGVAPTLSLTVIPPIEAYAANLRFRVNFNVASTGADTLNISAKGAKSLKQYDSTGAKVAAVFAANQLADIEYDGTDWVLLDQLPAASIPSGMIMAHGANVPPTGWLKANGATVSRTTYATLFAAISTTFGAGNGSTTFNLPDLRGEFVRGWDDGRGVDTGRVFGALQDSDNKSHSHATRQYLGLSGSSGSNGLVAYTNTAVGTNLPDAVSFSGGTESRPVNIALLYCIKI